MDTDPELKARENRARRAAQRQGLVIRKSPRRDPRARDYGGWQILRYGRVIAGGKRYSLTLDAVEAYLNGEQS